MSSSSAKYAFGSLWWCKEDLMRQRFASWGLNDRTRHPVLSINKSEVSSWELSDIPMLAGSSGLDGPVLVRGISEERGPDYPTVFGRLVSPGYFPRRDFFPPLKTVVSDGKWVFCSTMSAVWPNQHKAKINPAEKVYLEDFYNRHIGNS